jgi:hypothetical protein
LINSLEVASTTPNNLHRCVLLVVLNLLDRI